MLSRASGERPRRKDTETDCVACPSVVQVEATEKHKIVPKERRGCFGCFEQDKIADAKLVAALHFIPGEQILKSEMVTTSEGRMYARILNAAQIHSLKVVDILQDSLDMVSEAYSLWSPRGRDDSVRQVKSWMSAVIEVSDVLDTSITSSMCSRLHNSNWVFPQDTPVRPERIDGFLDESAFANFFEHIEKITAHWDADFAVSVGMEAFLSSTRRFDPNIRIRTAIRELCNAQAMCCPDESPEVLLADWRAKLSTDQPSGISSLFKVHGLSELLHDLVSQYKPAGNQTIPAGLEIQLVPGPRFEEIDDDEELPRKTVVAVADMANRVLDGAWGTIARNTLESCVGALSKELMNELALPAIVFPSNVLPRMVSVEPSPAHFARAFVRPEKMPAAMAFAPKLFQSGKDNDAMPAVSLRSLLVSLVGQIGELPCAAAPFFKRPCGQPLDPEEWDAPDFKLEHLNAISNVYCHIHEAAVALSYLHIHYVEGKEPILDHEEKVRSDVLSAVRRLRSRLHLIASESEGLLLADINCKMPQIFPVDAAAMWASSLLAQVPSLSRHFFDICLDNMRKLSGLVTDAQPSVSSYINDSTFLRPMAKRHLLQWKGRDDFSKSSVRLTRAVEAVKTAHKEFGIQPQLTCDPSLDAEVVSAEATFKGALCVVHSSRTKEKFKLKTVKKS